MFSQVDMAIAQQMVVSAPSPLEASARIPLHFAADCERIASSAAKVPMPMAKPLPISESGYSTLSQVGRAGIMYECPMTTTSTRETRTAIQASHLRVFLAAP